MQTRTDERRAVVIVGSTGLIGSRLVERLTDEFPVYALDIKPPETDLPDGASFIKTDVTDDESVRAAFEQIAERSPQGIASILQLAAYYDFSGAPSDLYDEITVRGTQRVLDTARKHDVEQFLFSSTMLVHEPTVPGRPIDEEHPLYGSWDYPQSKIETENMIRKHRGSIPAIALRLAGVYTDQCDSIPLAHQIQRIYENRLTGHVYPGDTRRGQAFVHIDDTVSAFEQAIQRRAALTGGCMPILIGEPETCSYETLQREFARLLHGEEDWETRQIPKGLAKSGAWVQDKIPGVEDPFIQPWMIDHADDHFELDISRAREQLNWEPAHRLIRTVPNMIAALEGDPLGWYRRHDLEMSRALRSKIEAASFSS